MTEFEYNINKEIDIATWEDEGGALKPVFVSVTKSGNMARVIWFGSLITLPFLFWLAKRQFQK